MHATSIASETLQHGTTSRASPALAGPCITGRNLRPAQIPFFTSADWVLEGREKHKQASQWWCGGGYLFFDLNQISVSGKINHREILLGCVKSGREIVRSPEQEGPANKKVLHHLKFLGFTAKKLTFWQEKAQPAVWVQAEEATSRPRNQGSRQGFGGCSLTCLQPVVGPIYWRDRLDLYSHFITCYKNLSEARMPVMHFCPVSMNKWLCVRKQPLFCIYFFSYLHKPL